jgi:hypothetical protein
MKKLVMLLALAVAFSLSGFAQTSSSGSSSSGTSSSDTGKTSKKKHSMASDSDTGAKSGKSSTVTGCLKSDATPVTLTNGRYKKGVEVDTSADTTDDFAKHNGHKVQLTGSWEGTGADKKFKATSMKHISETCTAGGKASAASDTGTKHKGKKGATDTSKTPS